MKKCTCEIAAMWRNGCTCGGFESEKAATKGYPAEEFLKNMHLAPAAQPYVPLHMSPILKALVPKEVLSKEEATKLLEKFHETYPKVKEMHERLQKSAPPERFDCIPLPGTEGVCTIEETEYPVDLKLEPSAENAFLGTRTGRYSSTTSNMEEIDKSKLATATCTCGKMKIEFDGSAGISNCPPFECKECGSYVRHSPPNSLAHRHVVSHYSVPKQLLLAELPTLSDDTVKALKRGVLLLHMIEAQDAIFAATKRGPVDPKDELPGILACSPEIKEKLLECAKEMKSDPHDNFADIRYLQRMLGRAIGLPEIQDKSFM